MTRGVGQHHGDLKNALLVAALEEIEAGGKVSLRAVARRAGVSPGAPYHHFPDKQALYAALATDGFLKLLDAQAPAYALPEPRERLETLVTTYVRFSLEHSTHYQIMFSASPGDSGFEELQEVAMRSFGGLCQAIAGVAPGLAKDEVRRRSLMAWSMAHGAIGIATQGMLRDLAPELTADRLATEIARTTLAIALGP